MAARPTVVVELAADAKYARELSDGAIYVESCELALETLCDLVVRGAMDEAVFDARVVLAPDSGGAALELLGWCPAMKQQLEFLIAATPTTARMEKVSDYDDLLRDVSGVELALEEPPPRRMPLASDRIPAERKPAWIDSEHGEVTPWPDEVHARTVLPRPRQLTQNEDEAPVWAPAPPSELSAWAEAIPSSRGQRSAWAEARPAMQRESSQWGLGQPAQLSPWADDDDLAVPVDDGALSIDDLDDGEDDDEEPVVIHAGRVVDDFTIDEPVAPPELLTEPAVDPLDALDLGDDTADTEDTDEPTDTEDDEPEDRERAALTVHERLRRLTLAQQLKKAHHGELQERVVLERMYGKTVWESLLRNPRITAPEVARIARMGQLPKPLIELIVSNGAWLQVPEVRRALLSNPRLAMDQIMRVLRMLPKHELKLASVQTAYPHGVRDVAKRLLKDSS